MTPVFITLSARIQDVNNVNRNTGTVYRVSATLKRALHDTVFPTSWLEIDLQCQQNIVSQLHLAN